jgi:hypothetical protein
MIEKTKEPLLTVIRDHVDEHYKKTDVPLFLSTLGQQLRADGAWPEGSSVNLRTLIERAPETGLRIIRNPSSAARIAVTDDAHKESVEQAILSPQIKRHVGLGNLPRSLLLAFCTRDMPDQTLYVQKVKPHRLSSVTPDPAEKDLFWEIPAKYRLDNCEFTSLAKLPPVTREALQANVRSWFQEQGLNDSAFPIGRISGQKLTALARLVNAQPEGLRRSLVIPADIALWLSKHE